MNDRRPFPKVDSSLLAGLAHFIEEGLGKNAEDHVRMARARLRALAAERSSDRYRFEEEIGRGGMGFVYRVQDNDLRRTLAMKVARGPSAAPTDEKATTGSDPVTLARFLEEARVTGQLDHPGIVPLHELGIDAQGCVYFTMRLVRGRHLGEVFEAAKTGEDGWTRERVVEAMVKVCDAMAYAHAKGVVHRDLKPENVMTGRFGEVYVMDWGVAKVIGGTSDSSLETPAAATMTLVRVASARAPGGVTIAGSVFGTPAYMAPEQARGALDEVDARSDVFSLGAMLYHLLAGHPPYLAPGTRVSSHTVLMWVIEGPPKTLLGAAHHAPRELVAICEKAMSREKRDRYASVSELADDLRAWLRGGQVSALRLGAIGRTVRWCRRNPFIAALLVAVSVGGALGLWRLTAVGGELVRQAAIDDAAAKASMLETVNGLYSSSVISRVDAEHVHVTHDWQAHAGAIPLPATFLTELADRISAGSGGTVVKHYSDLPFKFRGEPKLDEFGRQALASLRAEPDKPVTKFEEIGGRPFLRYAVARRMGASCVSCHNTHPESPKTDWVVGEVRGVLEIDRPLDAEVQRTRASVRGTLMEVAAIVAVLTTLCAIALVRNVQTQQSKKSASPR